MILKKLTSHHNAITPEIPNATADFVVLILLRKELLERCVVSQTRNEYKGDTIKKDIQYSRDIERNIRLR
jgi:hypothetical protein